jgi:hypothetical protein
MVRQSYVMFWTFDLSTWCRHVKTMRSPSKPCPKWMK